MLQIVYKFDEKSTVSVWKGKSTSKVPFKLFVVTHIHIGECDSTLYVRLSGIVRNLIQTSMGMDTPLLSIFFFLRDEQG